MVTPEGATLFHEIARSPYHGDERDTGEGRGQAARRSLPGGGRGSRGVGGRRAEVGRPRRKSRGRRAEGPADPRARPHHQVTVHRSESSGPRSEGRGRRAKAGGPRAKVRGRRAEVGGPRSEGTGADEAPTRPACRTSAYSVIQDFLNKFNKIKIKKHLKKSGLKAGRVEDLVWRNL